MYLWLFAVLLAVSTFGSVQRIDSHCLNNRFPSSGTWTPYPPYWTPTGCKITPLSKEKLSKCLKGRKLFGLGNSITRELLFSTAELLGAQVISRVDQKVQCKHTATNWEGCVESIEDVRFSFMYMQYMDGFDYSHRGGFKWILKNSSSDITFDYQRDFVFQPQPEAVTQHDKKKQQARNRNHVKYTKIKEDSPVIPVDSNGALTNNPIMQHIQHVVSQAVAKPVIMDNASIVISTAVNTEEAHHYVKWLTEVAPQQESSSDGVNISLSQKHNAQHFATMRFSPDDLIPCSGGIICSPQQLQTWKKPLDSVWQQSAREYLKPFFVNASSHDVLIMSVGLIYPLNMIVDSNIDFWPWISESALHFQRAVEELFPGQVYRVTLSPLKENSNTTHYSRYIYETEQLLSKLFLEHQSADVNKHWHTVDQWAINSDRLVLYNDMVHFHGALSLATLNNIYSDLCSV